MLFFLTETCALLTFDFFLPIAVPLKSELAYEIFDKGQVRFWLQAEPLSASASYRFIINDREVSDGEVSVRASSRWLWGVRRVSHAESVSCVCSHPF